MSQSTLCCLCGHQLSSENYLAFSDKLTEWLDNHPQFTWSYMHRKSAFLAEDPWLKSDPEYGRARSVETGTSPVPVDFSRSNTFHQKLSSSAFIPMREVSVDDFNFPDQQKILSEGSDGSPTFIPHHLHIQSPTPSGDRSSNRTRFTTDGARNLPSSDSTQLHQPNCDERKLLTELVIDVCQELDVTALCFKILQNVCILVGADRGSLFLVDRDRQSGIAMLISKLFDVTPECSFSESLAHSAEHRVQLPLGVGISGYVAETGECVNVSDAYADPRFSDIVDRKTGYRTKCLLCMPIKNGTNDVLAVALAINKRATQSDDAPEVTSSQGFTAHDVDVFKAYLPFFGIGLHNAQLYQKSRLETYRNQVLLELARVIFTEHSDIGRLVYTVLSHTLSLLRCQRCQILLVEEDTSLGEPPPSSKPRFSHCFDLVWNDDLDSISQSPTLHSLEDARFPIQLDLANKIVETGETVTLVDTTSDSRFDPSLETALDPVWRTRSLLCVPIKHPDGNVLAVCFITNKCASDWRAFRDHQSAEFTSANSSFATSISEWSCAFSHADESIFEAFALFVGLGLANRQIYDRVLRLVAKQRVLLDVLSYHATAPLSEAKLLASSLIPSVRFFHLDQFSFTEIGLSDECTLKASVRMFMELRFMKSLRIDLLPLCRWILSVKKNYREVTYHNWRHAFTVAQTMFAVVVNAQLQDVFPDIECLALLVACFSHDLDHRGTDNQFQVKTMSPLSQLYSTSVLEHHHFNQCMLLLSQKGNDFLSSLSRTEYQTLISLVKEFILATDLSSCFVRMPEFTRILQQHRQSPDESQSAVAICCPTSVWIEDQNHRSLMACMLMTACDISAITKPWPVQKLSAELVAAEFFDQGDLERDKLHTQPQIIMDRSNMADLPKLQLSFIDSVCLPVYEVIVQISDKLQPLLDGCIRNRSCWSYLVDGKEVPEDLFGLPIVDGANASSADRIPLGPPVTVHMGTINSIRFRKITEINRLQSPPFRRSSSTTTVGAFPTHPPDSPS